MRIIPLIALLFLFACEYHTAAIAQYGCPPLKQYSAESNKAFEATFKTLPAEAQNRLTDYRELRKECGQK